MRKFFALLSRLVFNNRKIIFVFWLLLLVSAILTLVYAKKTNTENELVGVTGTEAHQVAEIIEKDFNIKLGSSAALVLPDMDTTELEAGLKKAFPQMGNISEIASKKSHKNKLLFIQFSPEQRFIEMQGMTPEIREYIKGWSSKTGVKTYYTGNTAFHYDADSAGKKDSRASEAFALLFSLFILIYNFGALLSAFIPLLIGATTLIFLNGLIKFLGLGFNAISMVLTSMVGLALAIDYSLFIVSRFREEIGHGASEQDALEKVYKYSAKTIFVSALIMLCSVSALLLPDVSTSRTVVVNLILVILISLVNSVIILPVILVFGKNFLDKPRFLAKMINKVDKYIFWKQFATHILNYPKSYFIISVGILVTLSLPAYNLKLWEAVQTLTPENTESMDGYRLLEKDGWGGELIPVTLIVKAPPGKTVYDPALIAYNYDLTKALEKNPHVQSVQSLTSWNPAYSKNDYSTLYNSVYSLGMFTGQNNFIPLVNTSSGNNLTMINIYPKILMDLQETYEIINFVESYKKLDNRYELLTGGIVARAKDFTRELYGHVPLMLLIIFGGIYLILFFYMKSLVLPVKAAIMNFLPILSAFGILTLIYQYGLFHNLLRIPDNGTVINMVPIILFCIVFGLSMDYEVLILSRITEVYEDTGDVRVAIIDGLAKSGSVITGAVLILLGVFLPGIFSSSPPTKQICIGITSAIIIDATIVRLLLVPSFMMIMGHWNWWHPFKPKK